MTLHPSPRTRASQKDLEPHAGSRSARQQDPSVGLEAIGALRVLGTLLVKRRRKPIIPYRVARPPRISFSAGRKSTTKEKA